MLSTQCLLLYYKPNILTLSTLCVTFNQGWRTCTHYTLNLSSYRRCIALVVTYVCVASLYVYCIFINLSYTNKSLDYNSSTKQCKYTMCLLFYLYLIVLCIFCVYGIICIYEGPDVAYFQNQSINQSINQSEQSLSLKQIHTQYKVMSQQCYLKPFTHVVK